MGVPEEIVWCSQRYAATEESGWSSQRVVWGYLRDICLLLKVTGSINANTIHSKRYVDHVIRSVII